MVLKYFGSFSNNTRRILEILASCFMRFSVIKPVTSRPASAERYLVCGNFLSPETLPSLITEILHPSETNNFPLTPITSFLSNVDLKMLMLNVKGVESILRVLKMAVESGFKLEEVRINVRSVATKWKCGNFVNVMSLDIESQYHRYANF